jgi:predicted acylesterase/phospholipase RssA
MQHALTFAEWAEAGREHDRLSGADDWKADDRASGYDYELIRLRLTEIRNARERQDVNRLVFHLHEGLHGNLGNIANPALYNIARVGTKQLIETYLDEVCSALEYLCDGNFIEFSFQEKLEFFKTTGGAFGRSALMLSGGAALGLFHMGVLKALHEHGLIPHVISGSSAGSIMAAVVGSHSDEELMEILKPENLYLNAFRYVGWNGLFKGRPVLDGAHLEACLEENIPDMTFEEAFAKTGRAINVTVSPYDRHQDARLLNARTSPNVLIRKAVLASCAVPAVFPPVTLWAKNINGEKVPYIPTRKWVDGSIKDDLPIRRLQRLYGVNHSIVSQTNPHVVPFMSRANDQRGLGHQLRRVVTANVMLNVNFGLEFIQKGINWSNDLGLIVDKAQSVVAQKYVGDINIIPPRRATNVLRIFSNPSVDDVREFIETGERSTWPRIAMIRNSTRISRCFHDCLDKLRRQETERLARPSRLVGVK